MKVCLISKWDVSGGAPRATYRLFRALQSSNNKVEYIVHDKQLDDPNIHAASDFSRKDGFRDEGLIQKNYIDNKRTSISNTYFSVTCNGVDLGHNAYIHSSDIINLHWIEKFVSLGSLNYLMSLGKPIVWTLHDQRPFTGGCHYSAGCDQYKTNSCMRCEQLRKDPCGLPSAVLNEKKEIVHNSNIVVVSPSKWLAREASQSEVFKNARIEVIPNSIETEIFYPRDTLSLRNKLGISDDAFVILSGSHNNKERRKGYREYVKSLKIFLKNTKSNRRSAQREIVVISFGSSSNSKLPRGIRHIDLGSLTDDDFLAEVYSTADIFVMATLEDNLPNTVLEAMGCATPVIGFSVGGLPDMVASEKNGILVPLGDTFSLANAMSLMFENPEIVGKFSEHAKETIAQNYTQKLQASRYMELFRDLGSMPSVKRSLDEDEIYSCALERARREQKYLFINDRMKSIAKRIIQKFSLRI